MGKRARLGGRGGARSPPGGFLPLGLGRFPGLLGLPRSMGILVSTWYFLRIWAVRASHLAKKSHNKTPGVVFHAAFDGNAPGPWNTAQKSKNKQIPTFKKIEFSKIHKKLIWTYEPIQFFTQNPNPDPKLAKNQPKTWFWPFFENSDFFENFEKSRKSQGGGTGRKAY